MNNTTVMDEVETISTSKFYDLIVSIVPTGISRHTVLEAIKGMAGVELKKTRAQPRGYYLVPIVGAWEWLQGHELASKVMAGKKILCYQDLKEHADQYHGEQIGDKRARERQWRNEEYEF